MTLDWSFVPGMDLTRDPVVTVEDGWEVRRWPGCSVKIPPQALGDAEVATPMPNGCREPHGAIQELLDALWPVLKGVKTARQLGKAILDAVVDAKMKRPLALAARDRLGAGWSDRTVGDWLAPGSHSEERAQRHREIKRAWYTDPANTKRERERSRAWKTDPANAERQRETKRAWRADPVNAERHREANRYAARGEYKNERNKTRRKDDPVVAIAERLRARLASAVKAAGVGKSAGTFKLVGCTPEQLAGHLERHFLPGMTWENRDQWDVDHVRPMASFDLEDPAQQAACMHWSNLKPLWRADNIAKSSWHEGKRHSYRKHK